MTKLRKRTDRPASTVEAYVAKCWTCVDECAWWCKATSGNYFNQNYDFEFGNQWYSPAIDQ